MWGEAFGPNPGRYGGVMNKKKRVVRKKHKKAVEKAKAKRRTQLAAKKTP